MFGGTGFDTVHTKVDYFPQRDIEKIVGVGTASIFINLQGRDEPGDITGNAGANIIRAGFGNDILRGGAGNDLIQGARGNDNIYGDQGTDTLNGGGTFGLTDADRFHATIGMGQDTIAGLPTPVRQDRGRHGRIDCQERQLQFHHHAFTGSFKLLA